MAPRTVDLSHDPESPLPSTERHATGLASGGLRDSGGWLAGALPARLPQSLSLMHFEFHVDTSGPGLTDITDHVAAWLPDGSGLLTLFLRHTSASLLIQENADPEVQTDLIAWLSRAVPRTDDPSMAYLTHTYEGPDDMPGHIKAMLLSVSLTLPVIDGRMTLGRWQGIYLVEHRDRPQSRCIAAHFLRDR